jgi:hypothetical protein
LEPTIAGISGIEQHDCARFACPHLRHVSEATITSPR